MIGCMSENAIRHNAKRKEFPNHFQHTVASRAIFRERGWELQEDETEHHVKVSKPQRKGSDSRPDSVRRARQEVFEIALLNPFEYFVTLTFNPKKCNSKDPNEVKRILRSYLKNNVDRKGLFYVLVCEYHKDGKIHLHGFFGGNICMVDSDTRIVDDKIHDKPLKLETINKKKIPSSQIKSIVYNIPSWKYGFSTAIEIPSNSVEREKLVRYCTKYILKDSKKIFGNFFYAGGKRPDGQKLIREAPFELYDIDYDTFKCDDEVFCDAVDIGYRYYREPR